MRERTQIKEESHHTPRVSFERRTPFAQHVYMKDKDGHHIGGYQYELIKTPGYPTMHYVYNLTVISSMRGKGYGTALRTHIESEIQKQGVIGVLCNRAKSKRGGLFGFEDEQGHELDLKVYDKATHQPLHMQDEFYKNWTSFTVYGDEDNWRYYNNVENLTNNEIAEQLARHGIISLVN